MQQPVTINPDQIVQQTMQAKMEVYRAKEMFESVLKHSNDQLDNMVGLVQMMKTRILELEKEEAAHAESPGTGDLGSIQHLGEPSSTNFPAGWHDCRHDFIVGISACVHSDCLMARSTVPYNPGNHARGFRLACGLIAVVNR